MLLKFLILINHIVRLVITKDILESIMQVLHSEFFQDLILFDKVLFSII